jgi:hypothetical protein
MGAGFRPWNHRKTLARAPKKVLGSAFGGLPSKVFSFVVAARRSRFGWTIPQRSAGSPEDATGCSELRVLLHSSAGILVCINAKPKTEGFAVKQWEESRHFTVELAPFRDAVAIKSFEVFFPSREEFF